MSRLVPQKTVTTLLLMYMTLNQTESHRYCTCLHGINDSTFLEGCDETKEIIVVDSAYMSNSKYCERSITEDCDNSDVCLCPSDYMTRRIIATHFLNSCDRRSRYVCLSNWKNTIGHTRKDNFLTVDYHCLPKPRRYCSCVKSGLAEGFAASCNPDKDVVVITEAVWGSTGDCQLISVKEKCDQKWPSTNARPFIDKCSGFTPDTCRNLLRGYERREVKGGPTSMFIEYHCVHLSAVLSMCGPTAKTNALFSYVSSPGYPDTLSANSGACECDVTSTSGHEVKVSVSAVRVKMAAESCVEVQTSETPGRCLESSFDRGSVHTPFSISYTWDGESSNTFLIHAQGEGPITIHCRTTSVKSDKLATGILVAIVLAALLVLLVGVLLTRWCLRRSADSVTASNQRQNNQTVEIPEYNAVVSPSDFVSHQATAVDNIVYHCQSEPGAVTASDRGSSEDGAVGVADGGPQIGNVHADSSQKGIGDVIEENDTILVENDVYEGLSDKLQKDVVSSDEDLGDNDTVLVENDVYHRHHEDSESPPGAAQDTDSDDDSIFIENDVYEGAGDDNRVRD